MIFNIVQIYVLCINTSKPMLQSFPTMLCNYSTTIHTCSFMSIVTTLNVRNYKCDGKFWNSCVPFNLTNTKKNKGVMGIYAPTMFSACFPQEINTLCLSKSLYLLYRGNVRASSQELWSGNPTGAKTLSKEEEREEPFVLWTCTPPPSTPKHWREKQDHLC